MTQARIKLRAIAEWMYKDRCLCRRKGTAEWFQTRGDYGVINQVEYDYKEGKKWKTHTINK